MPGPHSHSSMPFADIPCEDMPAAATAKKPLRTCVVERYPPHRHAAPPGTRSQDFGSHAAKHICGEVPLRTIRTIRCSTVMRTSNPRTAKAAKVSGTSFIATCLLSLSRQIRKLRGVQRCQSSGPLRQVRQVRVLRPLLKGVNPSRLRLRHLHLVQVGRSSSRRKAPKPAVLQALARAVPRKRARELQEPPVGQAEHTRQAFDSAARDAPKLRRRCSFHRLLQGRKRRCGPRLRQRNHPVGLMVAVMC
mmetsp:Transcript_125822/g.298661  ORF Transcript_125822/g.298661 Transcript_125822/m.298661 type:complete len:248 (+) Transcript_125822:224-967(+)